MIRSGTINTIHELSAQGKSIEKLPALLASHAIRFAAICEENPFRDLVPSEARSLIPTKCKFARG